MNYTPGSATLKKTLKTETTHTSFYKICVTNICQKPYAYYGRSVWFDFEIDEDEMTEQTIFLLAYLTLTPEKAYVWSDCRNHIKIDSRGLKRFKETHSIGGHNIVDNGRFKEIGLLADDFGLFCRDAENYPDISSIKVEYHDEHQTIFNCELPDITALFDSEAEFISYFNTL